MCNLSKGEASPLLISFSSGILQEKENATFMGEVGQWRRRELEVGRYLSRI